MIHYIKDSTLVIEGGFEALSSGINGGRRHVDCLFNHQVQPDFDHFEPAQYLDRLAGSLPAGLAFYVVFGCLATPI